MLVPVGVSTLAFGKNGPELLKPARKLATDGASLRTIDEEVSPRSVRRQPSTRGLGEPGERHRHKRRAMHIDAVIIRDDQVTELPKLKGKAAGQRYRHGLTRSRVRFDRACLADPCNMQLSRLGREEIAGSGGRRGPGSTAACCLDGAARQRVRCEASRIG